MVKTLKNRFYQERQSKRKMSRKMKGRTLSQDQIISINSIIKLSTKLEDFK
ncbi:hypothetical protein PQC57_gp060 [Escherichia phage vB_EcoP_WFI101126]|uniref:Uncharacterized protein n=1 Tax=Escherichia phage vB_EcoP_WFI101126 TaxID=2508203 RepID=A0A482MS65_9CAUD|nr:hypothetical protein PQC57_gp060 [Escherichia phage vB_EcoP_WFI101126]QBQ76488.1 hypothetical protein WFI101126_00060 [Escherichia phage vB_EcoP_WFI101126]